MSNKFPPRLIDDFTWDSILEIQQYCVDNYAQVSPGDVDLVVSKYQKWLLNHGFKIVDNKDKK